MIKKKRIINTSFINLLSFACIIISLNSCAQSNECTSYIGIKSIVSKVYEAELKDGNFIKSGLVALSVTEESFDNSGFLRTSKSTSVYEGETMEDLSTYNYKNGVLKSTSRESKENGKSILESKILLEVTETNSLGLPIQVRDSDSTTLIEYTYLGCLEKTQTMTTLRDNKVFKTRTFEYDKKDELITITTIFDFQDKIISETAISNYVYNNEGDWTQRVMKNTDGSVNLETRTITYL